MVAEITFEQVWYNPSLLNFFFRSQAEETLKELIGLAVSTQSVLDAVEEYADAYNLNLDDIEEMFYSESVGTLVYEFGVETDDQEEEDE